MPYDDSNQGVLFRNDKRESDNHPLYKGNGEIHGVEVWISAWVNESKNGTKYLKLRFEDKQGQPGTSVQRNTQGQTTTDIPADTAGLPDPDDIPFAWDEAPLDLTDVKAHSNR